MEFSQNEQLSGLRFFSVGVVVKTPKVLGSAIIEVSPLESMNAQEPGFINRQEEIYDNTHPDSKGVVNATIIKSKNYFKAEWIPLTNCNRITPPNVVANEMVMLYKYANVDKYYWTTMSLAIGLRQLEKVRYAFSNQPAPVTGFTSDTSYWYEVDTEAKIVEFRTADNDGEYTRWSIKFENLKGLFKFKDEEGDEIEVDARDQRITVKSSNEVVVKAANKVIIEAPSIVLKGNVYVEGNLSVSKNLIIRNLIYGTVPTPASVNPFSDAKGAAIDSNNLGALFARSIRGYTFNPKNTSETSATKDTNVGVPSDGLPFSTGVSVGNNVPQGTQTIIQNKDTPTPVTMNTNLGSLFASPQGSSTTTYTAPPPPAPAEITMKMSDVFKNLPN